MPQSLTTVLVSGLVVGSFYGLAPLYANQLGLPNEEVGLYMGACIFAGLLQASLAGGCDEPRTGLCREGRLVFSTKVLLGYLAVLDVGLLIWCLRVLDERRQIRAALLVFIAILIGAVVFSIYVHS